MTVAGFGLALQVFGYALMGFSLSAFLTRRKDVLTTSNMLAAIGMNVCATCVLVIGTTVMFQDADHRLDRRLRAVEETHAVEERISPLVEEIYNNIHECQNRIGELEVWTGKASPEQAVP